MKKTYKAAALAMTIMLLASGCSSSSTAENDNSGIIDATSAVESYCGTTEISFSAVSEDSNIAMGTTGDIKMQMDPFYSEIDLVITQSEGDSEPEITESTMLLDESGDTQMVYLLHNDEWFKETVEASDFRMAASQYDVLYAGQLLMESSADMTKTATEDYNGFEADRYEGTIPQDMLCELFELTGSLSLVGTNIGETYFAGCGDLNATVWTDSEGVILGYELDLTDTVQYLFKVLYAENGVTDESVMIQFDSYIAKGQVTEYNNTIDTTIPAEALAAEEYTEE
ncbi:MAG: hypothetical protein LUE88_05060 [Clostridiales bacterium]|nr:hypothetical protein [Clostridiales bacterium]